MRLLLTLSMIAFGFTAQAAKLSCPEGTNKALSCTAADQPGDNKFAISYMTDAIVCSAGGESVMIIKTGDGAVSPAVPVEKVARVGATSYQFSEDNMVFSLSRMLVGPSAPANAKFNITINADKAYPASRSLKCK